MSGTPPRPGSTASSVVPDLVVIPARMASERLPGKPLLPIGGLPMVERVRRQASRAWPNVPVIVACDGPEIQDCVESHGGRTIVVSSPQRSGSDRVATLLRHWPDASLILNLQGDEVGLSPEHLRAFVARTATCPGADIWTPVCATGETERGVYAVEHEMRALYFSRAVLPVQRSGAPMARWLHRGAYLYRREALQAFAAAGNCAAEQAEGLEQLRALAAGLWIQLISIPACQSAIDTPTDLRRWETATLA